MISVQAAKEIAENYPNRQYNQELDQVEECIRHSAAYGGRKVEVNLSKFKNSDAIISELKKLGYTVKESDTTVFGKNRDVISW